MAIPVNHQIDRTHLAMVVVDSAKGGPEGGDDGSFIAVEPPPSQHGPQPTVYEDDPDSFVEVLPEPGGSVLG